MTLWRADPEGAASALVEASLDDMALPSGGHVLLAGGARATAELLTKRGWRVASWTRRMTAADMEAQAEPPEGPFDAVLLRLPKSKDELVMTALMAGAVARGAAPLVIYGGNDEGMRSATKRLAALTTIGTTVATRMHGRVERMQLPEGGYCSPLSRWRATLDDNWVTYPGLFADGRLDEGTRLLMDVIPTLAAQALVLDYGCGQGSLARRVRDVNATAQIEMIDNDAVALAAAAENVAGAKAMLGVDLTAARGQRYDLIVSNPPIHAGFREDHRALNRLIELAPGCLKAGGRLMMVVQRRIALDVALGKAFGSVAIATETGTGTFRVWSAVARG